MGVQSQGSKSGKEQIRLDGELNLPPLERYFHYLGNLVTGDLGTSYQLRQSVADVIGSQLGSTLALTALALVFAVILAGIAALLARGPRSKSVISLLELGVVSSPTFWTGLVLIAVFAFWLRWFPIVETGTFRSLVLPAVALALPVGGIISQLLRSGLDAAAAEPFAVSALARGISHRRLIARHTLRHATADTLTLTGYLVGSLAGGAVLIETVFARPGLGRVALRAIIDRDLPVVLGIIVLAAVVFGVLTIVVDALYFLIDPRLRTARGDKP